jgi:hypothetical protein
MKKSAVIFALSVFITCGFAAHAFAVIYYVNAATGQDLPDQGKTKALPFKTIGYALARSNATDVRVAAGTYNESLSIPEFRNITLRGAALAKTILAGDGAGPVVSVNGPTKVTITGFTIQNGTNGIWSRFAYVACKNIRLRNNSSHGLYAKNNSYLSLEDSTAISNGGHGVRVHSSSSGDIVRCTANSNASSGINVTYGSYGYIEASTASLNGQMGVQVSGSSNAYLLNNRIFSHQYGGVGINSNSNANFGGGNKIYDNADNSGWRAGVGVFQASSAVLIPEAANNPDEISQNRGPGIHVYDSSGLLLQSALVRNNGSGGVHIGLGSSGQIDGGDIFENNGDAVSLSTNSGLLLNNASIHDNTGVGVKVAHGSSAQLAQGNDIFGNDDAGISIWNNSELSLSGGSVHNNRSDGVRIGLESSGQFNTGASITDNDLFGVSCDGRGGFVWGDVGTISGNGSGDTNCQGWTP